MTKTCSIHISQIVFRLVFEAIHLIYMYLLILTRFNLKTIFKIIAIYSLLNSGNMHTYIQHTFVQLENKKKNSKQMQLMSCQRTEEKAENSKSEFI